MSPPKKIEKRTCLPDQTVFFSSTLPNPHIFVRPGNLTPFTLNFHSDTFDTLLEAQKGNQNGNRGFELVSKARCRARDITTSREGRAVVKLPRARKRERERVEGTVCSVVHNVGSQS